LLAEVRTPMAAKAPPETPAGPRYTNANCSGLLSAAAEMHHAARAARAATSPARSRAGCADERRDRKDQQQIFHLSPPF